MSSRIGIQQFANRVIRFRRSLAYRARAIGPFYAGVLEGKNVSNAALHRLIQNLFYASLMKDEGRCTRIRFQNFYGVGVEPSVVFGEPVPIESPDTIAKLAPATHANHSLQIHEFDGVLCATAIVKTEGNSSIFSDHFAEDYNHLGMGEFGTRIEVREAGHVEVFEDPLAVSYRHGVMKRYRSIHKNPLVSNWTHSVDESISAEIPENPKSLSLGRKRTVRGLVSTVIKRIIELGHGGAVVITPPTGKDLLNIRYPAKSGLLRPTLEQYWSLFGRQYSGEDRTEVFEFMNSKDSARCRLVNLVESIPQLTQVDGCIVFSRDLDFLGFGAVIQAQEGARKATRRLQARNRTELDPEQVLARRGTRHRAAYEFAKATEGAIVFVISQDGDLRVFASDENSVVYEDDLYP